MNTIASQLMQSVCFIIKRSECDARILPKLCHYLLLCKKAGGIEKLKAEAKRVSDKLRKQMKTEEAHRVTVMADELTEEWGELSMYAGMDAFLSYFFDERVGILDYFNPSDSLIFSMDF